MKFAKALLAWAVAAPALGSPLTLTERSLGMTCTDLLIPVSVNVTNYVIPFTYTNGIANTVQVAGNYSIGARYCEPVLKIRSTTLQVLVHGITYTRNYWSGAGPPGQGYQGNNYSWIAYASTLAYPTLSIDRLGNGLSSHPNPLTDVQVNAEVETIHKLILAARAGTLMSSAGINKKFKKIIYVGHSFGSILGHKLNALYPTDVNAAVLTGWSPTATELIVSQLSLALYPAPLAEPVRFGNLSQAYLVINNSTIGLELFYYANNFDLALATLDHNTRGTVSLGEIYTSNLPALTATNFTGPVLLLAGEKDYSFCPETADGITCGPGGWSPTLAATTSPLYPASSHVDAYSLPNVGHCWQYHYRAQLGFAVAHNWLAAKGF